MQGINNLALSDVFLYEGLASVFRDWAFTLVTATLYEIDRDRLDDMTLKIYRKGMAAFEGNTPTYHRKLRERPTLLWDFHPPATSITIFKIRTTC